MGCCCPRAGQGAGCGQGPGLPAGHRCPSTPARPGWPGLAAKPREQNLPLGIARSTAGPAGARAARPSPCLAAGAVLASPCFCCFRTSREWTCNAAGLLWRLGNAAPAGRRLRAVRPLCWEGLGGGGGVEGLAALGGTGRWWGRTGRPRSGFALGTQQGTQVKSLFQPLLHVEAEPGAGLSPAGFLCIAVHHQQRVPDVAAQSSVGNPDLAVDVTGNRKAGAQTRPARHRGCESQPCSNGTQSKAAVGEELRGMPGTGTRSSWPAALSKSCV